MSDSIERKLGVDMTSTVFYLSSEVTVDPSRWRHLCGVPDVRLWVVLDDLNEISETDEGNNDMSVPINVHGCVGSLSFYLFFIGCLAEM